MNVVTAIQNGDEFVFQQVFNEYHERLYFYLLSKSRSAYLAEEVTQLSFIKLWQYRTSLKADLSISIQLFRIAKTTLIDQIRKQSHIDAFVKEVKQAQPVSEFTTNNKLELDEIKRRLSESIKLLPPVRRRVFEMSRLEGMSYKEIADVLSVSVKNVEKHISKAIKQLRSSLTILMVCSMVIYYFIRSILK